MLNEAEARLYGGLLTAIGTAVMACGLVRVFIPGADWSLYAASGGIGLGFPLLIAGWKWLGIVTEQASADVWTTEAQARALDVETAARKAKIEPAKVVVIHDAPVTMNGVETVREVTEVHSAAWLAWRLAFIDGFAWARRLNNNITCAAMVKAGAFKRNEDWQAWADAMQLNRWLAKSPGVGSVLTTTTAAMRSQVLAGEFEHPAEMPPQVLPLSSLSATIPGIPTVTVSGESATAAD